MENEAAEHGEATEEAGYRRRRLKRTITKAAGLAATAGGAYLGYRVARRGGYKVLWRRTKALGRGFVKRYLPGGRNRAKVLLEEVKALRGVARSAPGGERAVARFKRYQRYRNRIKRLAAGRRAFRPMH